MRRHRACLGFRHDGWPDKQKIDECQGCRFEAEQNYDIAAYGSRKHGYHPAAEERVAAILPWDVTLPVGGTLFAQLLMRQKSQRNFPRRNHSRRHADAQKDRLNLA
jgi:hypothetical protein